MNDSLDPFALNVRGVTDLVENPINKTPRSADGGAEGQTGERIGVLDLAMKDEDLLKLRDEYEKNYAAYEGKIKPIFERNLESYLGKRKDGQWLNPDGPTAANLQFEAEETFLAAALAKNPDPVVWADNTPEGNKVATDVKTMLSFHSEQLVIKQKLGLMVRQWSIYHLGVIKYGWNPKINDVAVDNRRIQNFVFDPKGYVDAYGDFVGHLGERIEISAEKLIEMFPDHKDYISLTVDGQLGTPVTYTEWWSGDDTFTFTTYKNKVLAKNKNQYFNYEQPITDPMTGQEAINPMNGEPLVTKARNHFAQPKKPYTFLSVYSLQEQPHDITGNIEQNIANQNKITRRSEQIDYNVGASNNGYAFSEDNFNQETAKQASKARAKGNPILVPSGGPIERAILPLPAQELPAAIFNEVEIAKNDLRSSWGIVGISASPDDDDNTVRGEIIEQANDTTRIGGGVGDKIETVAKSVFNWLTQLYYVFYDEAHFAAVMGNAKAVEYVVLSNQDLNKQLVVSVAPDSLKPKDEVTQINLAQALFDKGAIGPKTLLKMLDFPNPDEAAADGMLYRLDPAAYMQLNFPEEMARLQQAQQQQMMQAQAGMAPGGAGIAPEQLTEPSPAEGLAAGPVDTKLSQIQMPSIPQGGPAA
jgi:hypothetical protein